MSKKTITFDKMKHIFDKYFYLEHDPDFLKVILATIIANRLDTVPVWLMVIGAPSSGKSKMLTTLDRCDETIDIDIIGTKSLVSGLKKKDTEDKKEASLLPKLNNKVVLVKDGSTIFSANPLERKVILSQLRQAFDGSLVKSSGAGIKSFDNIKFGMIVNITPSTEMTVMLESDLGERFIMFKLEPMVHGEDFFDLINSTINKQSKGKQSMQDAVKEFIDNCGTPKEIISDHRIYNLSKLLMVLKTPAIRDRYTKEIEQPMNIGLSESIRFVQQLNALYTSLYHIIGNKQNSLNIVYRIIKDNIPTIRLMIIRAIHKNSDINQKEISELLGMSETAVSRYIEEMIILNILKKIEFMSSTVKPVMENDKNVEKKMNKMSHRFEINTKYMDLFKIFPYSWDKDYEFEG
jgi:predicted transcriptional regulator